MKTKLGLWIALFTLFIYFLSYAGIQHSIDETATLSATDSIMRGLLQVNRMEWEQRRTPPQNAYGPDGQLYSKKGLGAVLLPLPFFAVGKQMATAGTAVGAVQLSFLTMGLVTAVTVFVFYQLAVQAGYTNIVAASGVLLLGLGTPLWPYAKWLFSEPLAALGICLTLLGLVIWQQNPARTRGLVWSGSGLAVAALARSANAILVLPVGFLVLGTLIWQFRRQRDWQKLWQATLAFGLPVLTAVSLIVAYNYTRFHTFFSYPLFPGETFSTPLQVGAAGLLWSPGKGMLWYAPVAWLIALSLLVAPRRMMRLEYAAALSLIGVSLLFYGRWYDWAGGLAWGPRFLVTIMPAVVMAGLPAVDWLWQPGRGRKWFLALIVGISLLAQLPGVLVNFEFQAQLDGKAGLTLADSIWQWSSSPLLTYIDNVFSGSADPVWLHPFFWNNPRRMLAGLLLAAGLIVTLHIIILTHQLRRPTQPVNGWRLAALAGLTAVFGLGMVTASYKDPRGLERTANQAATQAMRDWITAQAQPDDLILLDMRPDYDNANRIGEWLNFAPTQPDYLGWGRKSSVAEVTQSDLNQWLAPYGRVWLSLQATNLFDPNSTTEAWLREWAYPGQDQWFEDQQVIEFVLPGETETAVAQGGPIRADNNFTLASHTVRTGRTPNHLLVDLVWAEPAPEDLRFSLQVWDGPYQVRQQIDRRPQTAVSASGYHDRIGLVVDTASYTLVLKLYNAVSGQVYLFENTEPAQDALTLLAHPAP